MMAVFFFHATGYCSISFYPRLFYILFSLVMLALLSRKKKSKMYHHQHLSECNFM